MKAILAAALLIFTTLVATSASADGTTMYAHFIDVGQGNATLLEFVGGTILIDAGAQDDARVHALVSYLDTFFQARPHLGRTIDTVFITHNHVDHTRALREVAEAFRVRCFVENGQRGGLAEALRHVHWLTAIAVTQSRCQTKVIS